MTSPRQIHYGREVPGKIEGVTTLGIIQRKSERDFQRDLRRPNGCAVAKSLRFVDSVEALATPFGVVVCHGRVYSSIASE